MFTLFSCENSNKLNYCIVYDKIPINLNFYYFGFSWEGINLTKVTIKDVAYECGVSTATVSRVLNNKGYASPEVKEKVREVAKRLNYQPNAIARSLKMDRTYTIGIIIPDIAN